MACADREQAVWNDVIGWLGESPNPWSGAAASSESIVRTTLNNRGFTDVPCGTVPGETCKQFVRRIGIVGTPNTIKDASYEYGSDGFIRGRG